MDVYISGSSSTRPLGDIRTLGPGDYLHVHPSVRHSQQWPSIWEAIGVAWTRGAHLDIPQ